MTSTVTYIIPAFGMLGGPVFLGEHITLPMIAGFGMIAIDRSQPNAFAVSSRSDKRWSFRMDPETMRVVLKRFDTADETRVFPKGKLEVVKIGGMTLGRASYEPGWKWSEDVSPISGTPFCEVEHLGFVVSGRAMAKMIGGEEYELSEGTLFYIPPLSHDSWVIGDQPYVSIHFMGAAQYAT